MTHHHGNPLRSADHERMQRYRERLPHNLVLKVGARVILRRNVDIKGGCVNRTLASVIARHSNCHREDEQACRTLPSAQVPPEV